MYTEEKRTCILHTKLSTNEKERNLKTKFTYIASRKRISNITTIFWQNLTIMYSLKSFQCLFLLAALCLPIQTQQLQYITFITFTTVYIANNGDIQGPKLNLSQVAFNATSICVCLLYLRACAQIIFKQSQTQ